MRSSKGLLRFGSRGGAPRYRHESVKWSLVNTWQLVPSADPQKMRDWLASTIRICRSVRKNVGVEASSVGTVSADGFDFSSIPSWEQRD